MKRKLSLLILLLGMSFITVFTSCGDDDGVDGSGDLIDLSDANAVSNAIKITGATKIDGDPPSPSNDPNAPDLYDGDDVYSSPGGKTVVKLDLSTGDAAGIYMQVSGADNYFKIPASSFTGGRFPFSGGRISQSSGSPSFELELPDNISPGEFCIDLCVYDDENRVSNIVTTCVVITEIGGEDGQFLVGQWNITRIEDRYEGITYTRIIGEETEETYRFDMLCADGETYQEVEITETELFEYINLIFSSNGALRFKSSYENSYLDYENSTCENVEYYTESGMEDYDGVWSYTVDDKRLILVINFEEDGQIDQEVLDLKITVNGDNMTAIQDYGGGDKFTITLVKQ
ncbi:hypothetical protein [Ekhidna sp.]|uniref:hypothetical protein n=1 Tax=Ekhidna sp. TaxID=2608089 RepID=UPI0032EBB556